MIQYYIAKDNKILPFGWREWITRDDLLGAGVPYNHGETMAYKSIADGEGLNRYGCTALLMLDDWEIKDDYPFN